MNNIIEELLNKQPQDEIKTDQLKINKNILITDKTTLQLSNISSLDYGHLKVRIPYLPIIIWIILSFVFLRFIALLGVIMLIALGVYIYALYQKIVNPNLYLYIKLNQEQIIQYILLMKNSY